LSNKKIPQDRFRSMSHGNLIFSTDQEIYGRDNKAKENMKGKSPFVESAPYVVSHDGNFKLVRRGHGDPIGKYP